MCVVCTEKIYVLIAARKTELNFSPWKLGKRKEEKYTPSKNILKINIVAIIVNSYDKSLIKNLKIYVVYIFEF